MSPTEVTTVAGVIIAIIGSICIPLYLNRVKDNRRDDHAEGLDSRSVAAMFKSERDGLQNRLDRVVEEYEQKLVVLRADYERKLSEANATHQAQIAGLRAEIDALYRRLYSTGPPPVPPVV